MGKVAGMRICPMENASLTIERNRKYKGKERTCLGVFFVRNVSGDAKGGIGINHNNDIGQEDVV